MATIAVILTDDFEDVEYTKPVQAYQEKGHRLEHIGLQEGQTVKGKKEGTPVTIDKSVKNARVADYEALLIPGGYSPDKLRVDADAVRFAREFVESGKPIFAICHAAQLLITAEALQGRKITGWKSIIQDIKNAGAEYQDSEVVEDANLISSRGPQDIPAFIDATLRRLH